MITAFMKSMSFIQQKKLDEFLATVQGTFSEKIFRDLRFSLFTGWRQFMNQIKHTMEDLAEAGFEFTMEEANKFMQLIQEFVNNSHLYINRGWTPSELAEYGRKKYPNQKPVITLGPGVRKAIENGEISLEDLKAQAKANGFEIKFSRLERSHKMKVIVTPALLETTANTTAEII